MRNWERDEESLKSPKVHNYPGRICVVWATIKGKVNFTTNCISLRLRKKTTLDIIHKIHAVIRKDILRFRKEETVAKS